MKKVGLILCGVAAFVVASAGASIVGTLVNGLIPNNRPDPPGELEPSPEERSKKEWAATQTKSDSKPQEPKQEAKQPAAKETPVEQPKEPATTSPTPEPVVAAPSPPRLTTGPGNLDAPVENPYFHPVQTGPGNL